MQKGRKCYGGKQELLLNQIIDLHGKVVYTYTTHHKIQNRLERINKGVKISQIILTAVSTVGFLADSYNKISIC